MAGRFFWNDTAVIAVAKKAALDFAERAMGEVGQASQQRAARKTGAMRGTARVEVGGDKVVLTYGGESAPYALIQHEHAPYKHPTTPGTQPKYVEVPFRTMVEDNPAFFSAMGNQVRAVLRSTP